MKPPGRRRGWVRTVPFLVVGVLGLAWLSGWSGRKVGETPRPQGPRMTVGRVEPQVVVSLGYGALLDTEGGLWLWGFPPYAPVGPRPDPRVPHRMTPGTNWVRLSASGQHLGLIRTDGTLWGLGGNFNGQLGQPLAQWYGAVPISRETNWVDVVALEGQTLALTAEGRLWWAGGALPQTIGALTNAALLEFASPHRWERLEGSGSTAYATRRGGGVDRIRVQARSVQVDSVPGGTNVRWQVVGETMAEQFAGLDAAGRLLTTAGWVIGSLPAGRAPTGVRGFDFVAGAEGRVWRRCVVTAGGVVAQCEDGSWWGLGPNRSGQLGLGDRSNRVRLTRLPWPSETVALAGGAGTMVALLEDGSLWFAGQELGASRREPQGPIQKVHDRLTQVGAALGLPGARSRLFPVELRPRRLWVWPGGSELRNDGPGGTRPTGVVARAQPEVPA